MGKEKADVTKDNALLRLHKKLQANIADVPEVKELLALFKDNNLDTQAKDFEVLLSLVDDAHRAFDVIKQQDNRSLLKIPFKDKDNIDRISRPSVRGSAINLKVGTFSVKHEILIASVNIMNSFKDKGFLALSGQEFDAVKQHLSKLRLKIVEHKIAVSSASDKFNKMKHTDINDLFNQNYKPPNPFNEFHRTLLYAKEKVANAEEKVDSLSKGVNTKEKTSIMQKLKDEKVNITEPTTTKPKTKEQTI